MDPLTQGIVGSVGATQASHKGNIGLATFLGFISGLSPDLDVLIRSDTDPLLALEYHRQFTHSLLFIPIGGLLCALFLHLVFARKKLKFSQTYLFCTLGYATHALIDACTTYGTLLFWPISHVRFAWNTISIIDPLFTLPLFILILANLKFKKWLPSTLALCWILFYFYLGFVQRDRAEAAGWALATSRGLDVIALEAKPSFANILVWKVISSTEDSYYVDAIRVGLDEPVVFEGERVKKLKLSRDFSWLDPNSQQAKDIERFRWFSMGYLAVSTSSPDMIIDMRYSMLPNQVKALWGIRLDKNASPDQHVEYVEMRDTNPAVFTELWQMISKPDLVGR